MKKIFIGALVFIGISMFSQVQKFDFVTNVPDAEPSYVILPNKDSSQQEYMLGYIYFDGMAGYSFRAIGELKMLNNKLSFSVPEEFKKSMHVSRVGNFGLKLAKLNSKTIEELKLQNPPDWLATYYSNNPPTNEQLLKRASMLNGGGAPQLALPRLKSLYDKNFRSQDLYFELAFAYNALKDFQNAEKITDEAIKLKKDNDNLKKEYVYALVNQKKITEAEDFMIANENKFSNDFAKSECYLNIGVYSAHFDKLDVAKKWLAKLSLQPNASKFQKNIDTITSIIKEKENQKK